MAELLISSNIFPYRLRLNDKKAGELGIVFSNKALAGKKLSVEVVLPGVVAFDRIGFSRAFKREVSVDANASKKLFLPVYVSNKADSGVYSGVLVVRELSEGSDYVVRNFSKELSFRIIP